MCYNIIRKLVKLVMNKNKKKTYTIIWHQVGQEDQVRHNIDSLNAAIIPVELKMAFPKEFVNGTMSVEVILEK